MHEIERRALLGALAAGAMSGAARAEDARLTPPADQRPRANVVIAPYRYDDVLWENDRVAHRIYGRALEAHEPPSGSGIDAWGKKVRWPFMERQLHIGDQHADHGEGVDFYNVGTARGCGGLGVWYDNKLWTSRNYRAVRILQNGPDAARFEVDYAPWPVDVVRTVSETRRFELPLGANFTRLTSTISSNTNDPLLIGVGLNKRPNTFGQAALSADRARGAFSAWGGADPTYGNIGVAVLVDPRQIADVKEDADNYLVLLNVAPGQPFSYRIGACWDRGLDFTSRAAWDAYVLNEATR
ncbi:MAG TPA: DUF4861 family protein [Caulobacterales bacterium]|nr:DUF4861 family protein [Caulobacterales bacterium]